MKKLISHHVSLKRCCTESKKNCEVCLSRTPNRGSDGCKPHQGNQSKPISIGKDLMWTQHAQVLISVLTDCESLRQCHYFLSFIEERSSDEPKQRRISFKTEIRSNGS